MTELRSGRDRRASAGRVEQERLRGIIERLADGIVIVDSDGVIQFANPSAEALFGRPFESLDST